MIQVVPGAAFELKESDTVVIRPGRDNDYLRLVTHLADQGRIPDAVAHLWGLTAQGTDTRRVGPQQDRDRAS